MSHNILTVDAFFTFTGSIYINQAKFYYRTKQMLINCCFEVDFTNAQWDFPFQTTIIIVEVLVEQKIIVEFSN